MPTLRSASAPVKPARKIYPAPKCEVSVIRPVIYPCALRPEGFPGSVDLNGDQYTLEVFTSPADNREGFVVEGYRFVKVASPHEPRDVQQTAYGLECDCPDHLFRIRVGGCCKHCLAVQQLRSRGELV